MFLRTPEISVIGLSRISVPKCWKKVLHIARPMCVNRCLQITKDRAITFHLLGLTEPNELSHPLYRKEMFRSIDSKLPIKYGAVGISIRQIGWNRIHPHLDFNTPIPNNYYPIVEDNINYIEELLR